ncbi:MAG: pyridoxal-phosphate-dependent aminotransferase family protein [Chloroflexota bacterium]
MSHDLLLLTPGPTAVADEVRLALAEPAPNPDIDPGFAELYRDVAAKLGRLMGTSAPVLILPGEGLCGLEAAVAALVEPGEAVICLDNGVFGGGFADFVARYGGRPLVLREEYDRPFSPGAVAAFADQHPEARVATLVHCETPAGLINPVAGIIPELARRGIITIVDAVSSLGGEPFAADAWGADIVLGASQKCLSAPPGLAFLSVSERAWERIAARKSPVPGFYLNLTVWRENWLARGEFPYTQSAALVAALNVACERLLGEDDPVRRHAAIAAAVRAALTDGGLSLYAAPEGRSNTVTAVRVPLGVDDARFRQQLVERHGLMIGGSFGPFAGKLWRIGHMGEGASSAAMFRVFHAFDRLLPESGFWPETQLTEAFARHLVGVEREPH